MSKVLVKLIDNQAQKVIRTWSLRESLTKKTIFVGTSRFCDIRVPDQQLSGALSFDSASHQWIFSDEQADAEVTEQGLERTVDRLTLLFVASPTRKPLLTTHCSEPHSTWFLTRWVFGIRYETIPVKSAQELNEQLTFWGVTQSLATLEHRRFNTSWGYVQLIAAPEAKVKNIQIEKSVKPQPLVVGMMGLLGIAFVTMTILLQTKVSEPPKVIAEIKLPPPVAKKIVEAPQPRKVQQVSANPGGPRVNDLLGRIQSRKQRSRANPNVVVETTAPLGAVSAKMLAESIGANSLESVGARNIASIGGQDQGAGKISGDKVGLGQVGLLEDESEITGGLDREVIAAYIQSQIGQILYCYERQLSAQPDLMGKVAIHFMIKENGQVETSKINQSTLRNHRVESCILARVARWQFPKPQGGMKVAVTYPFLFKSTH